MKETAAEATQVMIQRILPRIEELAAEAWLLQATHVLLILDPDETAALDVLKEVRLLKSTGKVPEVGLYPIEILDGFLAAVELDQGGIVEAVEAYSPGNLRVIVMIGDYVRCATVPIPKPMPYTAPGGVA